MPSPFFQPKLPLQPGIQKRAVKRSEDEVQNSVVLRLRALGFEVLSTSEHRRRESCPRCGTRFFPKQGRGCDKGVPDLLITHPDYPAATWLGLEVKGSGTPLSLEQKDLRDRKRILVVRDAAKESAADLAQRLAVTLLGHARRWLAPRQSDAPTS